MDIKRLFPSSVLHFLKNLYALKTIFGTYTYDAFKDANRSARNEFTS
jgi:hypothetical protein